MIEIEEYKRDGQTSPFKQWFLSLSVQARLKVSTSLLRLEMGNTSNIKWFDGMGEYRIDWGPGYRIYLIQEGQRLIILFGGGDKSSQKRDIRAAKSLIRDYQRDKKTEQKR
ncbi:MULTISPECIES: type II toxin-antitoxin system RelE/ParE family toxin [Pseudomonas]|uniref:Type II toxin-antitoxin system RelE/ParE family toxin n=1 Tax=Pseudomonas gessardii TaxID=78544 RepID=A0A7Y1ML41_9PSED|nr:MULTISPECIES: type II toxin-antitoxin system RelE/ParE family toxin [Pseudomonas]MBH3424538.1 type II toxin-antitoxin system RelE/ParE family toxin [Pseudomonas gessardii]MCF4976878.1 type II toxin-antitoxin system RelE/ParE family toxin [Pseudomonas gessardii]MCF4991378.1 type II toxin-antitoxin system RelE/ParE family toxin [Pseudomonas gessardii]MCF5082807.1 type II toxin-antitoxin system RelE/ParE family toxin [Pseudomonas gessardii]MCF5093175.1 type II toxin-antitoxin system RelE/ParE 